MQHITLIGFVGRDPEKKEVRKGLYFWTYSLGVKVSYRKEKKTQWYEIGARDSYFSPMFPYIKKGTSLCVIGSLDPPYIYKGKDGEPRVKLSVTADTMNFLPLSQSQRDEKRVEAVIDVCIEDGPDPLYS